MREVIGDPKMKTTEFLYFRRYRYCLFSTVGSRGGRWVVGSRRDQALPSALWAPAVYTWRWHSSPSCAGSASWASGSEGVPARACVGWSQEGEGGSTGETGAGRSGGAGSQAIACFLPGGLQAPPLGRGWCCALEAERLSDFVVGIYMVLVQSSCSRVETVAL